MQAPICEVCLRSELLCAGCADKLNRGELSQAEIDVCRALYAMSDKMKGLKEVRLRKVIDTAGLGQPSERPSVLLLIAGTGDGGRLVGKGGAVVKALAKQFDKSIRVLEEAHDMRAFAAGLLAPAAIAGIDTVYGRDGESFRIRLPEAHRHRITIAPETATAVLSGIYSRRIELAFEP